MELKELRDIAISAIVLAFIFVYQGVGYLSTTLVLLPAGLLLVSASFVLHELGHRALARKSNFHAEYVMWPHGLLMALLLAIATNGAVAFAAPGAVVITPKADLWGRFRAISGKAYGTISAIGPAINIALAAIFLAAALLLGMPVLMLGASINAWLAIFNLLPFGPLDGAKVMMWDRRIWLSLLVCAIAVFILVQIA